MFGRKRKLDDFSTEIDAHLALEIERLQEQGLSEEQARAAAHRAFGNVRKAQERFYESGRWLWWDHFWQDVRYALRILCKNPAFTAVAVLTLALGIGGTIAIFSAVNTIVLKPLPFPTADRLMRIESVFVATGRGSGIASYPDFVNWRARNQVFDGMAVVDTRDFTLVGPREPLHLQGAVVSAQLFSVLGVAPVLGRTFLPQEDSPATANGTDPVILSRELWAREFDSDPTALGRTIQLDGQAFTIVGVMGQSFQFPIQSEPVELWTTIAADVRGGANAMAAQRGAHYLKVIGLLKRGVGRSQAEAEMATIASALNKQYPENKPRTVLIVPEVQALIGPARVPLLVLLAAVGCVFLIACANVANLLLARAARRHREMAMRAVLGASPGRILRQLLTESAALGVLGGGAGLVTALGCLKFLTRPIPADAPRANAIHLDFRLLMFALSASLAAGILFGLAPALQLTRIGLTEALKESERNSEGKVRQGSATRWWPARSPWPASCFRPRSCWGKVFCI